MTARTKDVGASTRALHTPTELAQSIARLESEATLTLSRNQYQTAGKLYVRCLPLLVVGRDVERGEFEAALDVLAIRGLVSLDREEWEVTSAKPQRYRWSRLATLEALTRFASTQHRCAYERCGRILARRDIRFCNSKCASLKSHARMAK